MFRPNILQSILSLAVVTTVGVLPIDAQDRRSKTDQNCPHILWITAEDMSPTLGCYGDSYAITPNIDQLASESARYTYAFATSPVCSPSRACSRLATTKF